MKNGPLLVVGQEWDSLIFAGLLRFPFSYGIPNQLSEKRGQFAHASFKTHQQLLMKRERSKEGSSMTLKGNRRNLCLVESVRGLVTRSRPLDKSASFAELFPERSTFARGSEGKTDARADRSRPTVDCRASYR
jgi:hypothetical protein